MIFADHGMKEIQCENRTECRIFLEDYMDIENDLEHRLDAPNLWPKNGKLDQVIDGKSKY